jgi:predicted metalloendopeptidase
MSNRQLAALLAGAAFAVSALGANSAERPMAPSAKPTHGIDLAGMDRAVSAGADFFRYANGSWLKTADIPADRSSWGNGAILTEEADKRTVDLIQSAASGGPAAGSDARKIGDFYASYMDEAAIETKGLAHLKAELDKIAAIHDRAGLARALGGRLRADVDPLNNTNFFTENVFGLWVAQGLEDPKHYVPYLLQGGLGLPDREYYLAKDSHMAEIRTKYLAYIAGVLKLAGVMDADAKATRIMDLETRIAQSHAPRAESEDVLKANNPWKRAEFASRAPGLNWQSYFAGAGLGAQPLFIVWQPSAMKGEAALASAVPIETWKDYLAFHTVNHLGGVLPKAFVDLRFAFYGTALSGTPKIQDRWKRGVAATNAVFGEAVGRLYVQKYFSADAKAKVQAMVKDLIAAFDKRIGALAWMAPQTKVQAKAKLKTLYVGVGYPETWRDYSALEIVRGDAFGNLMRAELFDYQRNLGKLGHGVDKTEWSMTPQTVNAVNMPLQNALNFPAAILQPPYFDPAGEAAINYGAIGAIIGHEISHSFDDQGSQFDAEGRLFNWWTPQDFAHFKSSSAALIAQYDAYHPFPDVHVNGQLTLSENIADVAGLSAAYDAYRIALGGQQGPVRGGLTGDQQFFLAFAQSWRTKIREPALRQRLVTDGHAPGEYRADTVRNLDPWYQGFGVRAGEGLYLSPEARVRIW